MDDISKITDSIYISSFLDDSRIKNLDLEGFGLIISMIGPTLSGKNLEKSGCKILSVKTHDNFLLPIPMKAIGRGVEAAAEALKSGHKILIYCREGKRRSVTMAACILIANGTGSADAMQLIKKMRLAADPYRWYVKKRIRKFEKFWKDKLNP
ncbi:MAG: dual specificity protein phosphatase family protein [Candidatus Omnitrophica bacterium]|nr:dual specificity protein phosphatase family protein [Candidatus Omnitrophota bacterium]